MATARTTPPSPDPSADDGFNETQKSQLSEMIAAAVGGAKPPETVKDGPKPVTDDQWDNMSDRSRESFVRQIVDAELDRLVKEDETRSLAADVAALKAGVKLEPEKTPGMMTKLQKLIWGDRDQ
jgi:hypothetical protein